MEKTDLSDEAWRKRLSPEQYHVLRESSTEHAFALDFDESAPSERK